MRPHRGRNEDGSSTGHDTLPVDRCRPALRNPRACIRLRLPTLLRPAAIAAHARNTERMTHAMHDIDQDKARQMLGKVVLAGVTLYGPDGAPAEHRQHVGTVVRISAEDGVVLVAADGGEVFLPPYLEHYVPADPGVYTLAATGQTVTDPDYLSTWDVHPPVEDGDDAS